MPASNVHAPVRTEGLRAIYCGCEPSVDYDTGAVRTDRATGQPIYRVHLMVMLPGEVKPQVWTVNVVGEPKGLDAGEPVGIGDDLVVSEWENGPRHGITFRASAVFPARSANGAGRSGAVRAEAAA